ncbi:MAG: imidazole glycerol phosphate synthase subunit HisH [Balneolaceae bacterium]|nr:MAG: imidazole glycerol phosphate synthase subunit HisH [Balneolaceae bacterium]
MIAIVNYGLGNIRAFANVLKQLNVPHLIAETREDLLKAHKLILPGVGAFDHAMGLLSLSGMRETLDELVLEKRLPVLGICVGMQLLAESSEEGELPGLGWIPGRVNKLHTENISGKTKLPHMGWNLVCPERDHSLFNDLPYEARFYFLHSYYFECADPFHSIATTGYGTSFSSAVSAGNIHGVQFHPEKSHENGILILKNFSELN